MDEVWIPIVGSISLFGMITAVVVLPSYFRSRERRELQATIRAAIEKGQPLPPEVIEAIGSEGARTEVLPSPHRDLRRGVIWLAVALGLVTIGVVDSIGDGYFDIGDADGWWAFAALPGFVGLAFIVLGLISRSRTARPS
jgi:hypothetical protein